MRIPRQLQFNLIEDVLSELDNAGSYVLTAPIENKFQALGGEAALVQAYITWAQHEQMPQARLGGAVQTLEDAVERFASLSLVLLASKLMVRERDVTAAISRVALSRLALLQSPFPRQGSRGPQIEIVCADHLGKSYPVTLYDLTSDRQPTPKPQSELGDLARLILKTTMPSEFERGRTAHLLKPLAGTLYELFRNTHEHAREDLAGNLLKRSIRAVQARRHSITPQVLAQISADSQIMSAYCRRLAPRRGRAHLNLLELSVLDSGPGLAARWLARRIEQGDRMGAELQAVLQCFANGTSTKRHPGAGMGLPTMIALARAANGFLRLRTGAHSLGADLGIERDLPMGAPPNLQPLHGDRIIGRAAGTLWSLLLPIEEVA